MFIFIIVNNCKVIIWIRFKTIKSWYNKYISNINGGKYVTRKTSRKTNDEKQKREN